MRKVLVLIFSFLFIYGYNANAQGCVAIRNLAGFGQFASLGYTKTSDTWSLDINNRYFTTSTVFFGNDNKGYDGINGYEYTVNFGLTKILKNGWSLGFDLPILANTGTSTMNAQGGRHHQRAFGVGDIRFTAYKWLFDENKARNGNIQVGLGIKFPTGNYKSVDYFYYSENPVNKSLQPLAEALQLGDGGTAITPVINAFYIFNRNISIYGNFFYMISPVNTNGVPSFPANVLPRSQNSINAITTNNVNSVPDAYTLRVGANYTFESLVATVGFRYEGSPAHDLFGDNDGLRRVGYIFSIEPGLQYKFQKSILYTFV